MMGKKMMAMLVNFTSKVNHSIKICTRQRDLENEANEKIIKFVNMVKFVFIDDNEDFMIKLIKYSKKDVYVYRIC